MREGMGIKPIRPFTKDDIPQVADMFQRLLLSEGPSLRALCPEALTEYFEQTFFHHPWYDEAFPSLVCQDSGGKIIGFIGIVTRPMLLRGQHIRMAISFHLMVEPRSRSSMAGAQLLRTLFSGPQDLYLTDGAGQVGRKVWEGVGGATALLYSQCWTRVLRPTRHVIDLLSKRKAYSPLARALSPICHPADGVAARMFPRHFSSPPTHYSEEELDVETFLDCLPRFSKVAALQPVYDDYSLRWLLGHAERIKYHGDFKKVLVRDSRGEVAGWFMYYLKPGGASTVFQLVARKEAVNETLDSLFDHARRHGAASITGRLYPPYMQELSDKHCYFHRNCAWALVHSNNDELLNVIHRGGAFLTGLEGESCLLF
jgi:hypothetical protein